MGSSRDAGMMFPGNGAPVSGISDRGADLREISPPHRRRRHAEEQSLLVAQPEALVIRHEEELVPAVDQRGIWTGPPSVNPYWFHLNGLDFGVSLPKA